MTAAYPYYTAVLTDGGQLDESRSIAGYSNYASARLSAENSAKNGISAKTRIVVLETRETVWAEPAIKDDLPEPEKAN